MAALTFGLTAFAVIMMPIGIVLASSTPDKTRAGITVFDLFDLSPEQFATLMTSSGE